jgi:hypothetical protein
MKTMKDNLKNGSKIFSPDCSELRERKAGTKENK